MPTRKEKTTLKKQTLKTPVITALNEMWFQSQFFGRVKFLPGNVAMTSFLSPTLRATKTQGRVLEPQIRSTETEAPDHPQNTETTETTGPL